MRRASHQEKGGADEENPAQRQSRVADDLYVGRFRIVAGTVGATEETDGIDLLAGDFGSGFPGGLLVAQDGQNGARAQNFKLVAWGDVANALGLPAESR